MQDAGVPESISSELPAPSTPSVVSVSDGGATPDSPASLREAGQAELKTHITVVGVRFKPCCKIYLFEADGTDVNPGTWVVAESEMGLNLGRVVQAKHITEKTEQPVKKLLRVATEKDFETDKNNRSLETEAKAFCIEKAKSHNLPMKVVITEATLDRKRLIFYFTADERIDFRELVRDLAGKFKTRIEMRQIGVRDEVKCIGGIGVCGRQTCCTLFLTSFEPVSIRMAKKQELVLNPSKLSGICGRLMCCLGYEYKQPADGDQAAQEVPAEEPVLIADTDEVTYPKEEAESRDTGKPSETYDKDAESKIQGKEDRIRSSGTGTQHKKHRGEPRRHVPETAQHETESKGKPFSRRRSFWKKRKNKE
ncbi:MAG: stage 0 sporulation protein [Nitrospirae bacterium]|nr:stage 0 sporulation protein [Nitrospirota bacterium]